MNISNPHREWVHFLPLCLGNKSFFHCCSFCHFSSCGTQIPSACLVRGLELRVSGLGIPSEDCSPPFFCGSFSFSSLHFSGTEALHPFVTVVHIFVLKKFCRVARVPGSRRGVAEEWLSSLSGGLSGDGVPLMCASFCCMWSLLKP